LAGHSCCDTDKLTGLAMKGLNQAGFQQIYKRLITETEDRDEAFYRSEKSNI